MTGGPANDGTIYKITPAGTRTTLYAFSAETTTSPYTNADGAVPVNGLIQGTDGNFYGMTNNGGLFGTGTVFKITSTGTLTTLHSFSAQSRQGSNTDGAFPNDSLVQASDGDFYGTTQDGGLSNQGTVFKITIEGTFTTLVSFNERYPALPHGSLVQGRDGDLYGTTFGGGLFGNGSVFKITTAGALTTLFAFDYTDGAYPQASLLLGSDGNFYGTTMQGGPEFYSGGTVFEITPGGTLTTLFVFPGNVDGSPEGQTPDDALIQGDDGSLYGTTLTGGTAGYGTVFKIAFVPAPTVIAFTPNSGAPGTRVIITGTNLRETTQVEFQGRSAGTFTVNGAGTQIIASVPLGAVSGPIDVQASGVQINPLARFNVIPALAPTRRTQR